MQLGYKHVFRKSVRTETDGVVFGTTRAGDREPADGEQVGDRVDPRESKPKPYNPVAPA